MIKTALCLLLLIVQQPAQYPFDATSTDWLAAKKLGVISSSYARPLMDHVALSLRLELLNERSVGHLDRYYFRIQVADENNLRLMPDKNMHSEKDLPDLWLTNYPTKNLIDDERVVLAGSIRVVGTQSYNSIGGKRTVRKIEFVPRDEAEAVIKKLIDELDEFKKQQEEAQYFTLKSRAGTEVSAKYIGFKNGKVELKTKDNRDLKLALDVFADETADVLRKMIRAERSKK